MTAFGSIETAVEAMKAGAVDFLPKPFSMDHLMTVVAKALEVRTLRDENRELRAELSQRYEFDNIIGRSAAMREIFATRVKEPAPALMHCPTIARILSVPGKVDLSAY